MSIGSQILGWGAAAVLVGGAIKFIRDYDKIGKPTKGKEPFDTPELRASRAEVEAGMRKLRAKPSPPPTPK